MIMRSYKLRKAGMLKRIWTDMNISQQFKGNAILNVGSAIMVAINLLFLFIILSSSIYDFNASNLSIILIMEVLMYSYFGSFMNIFLVSESTICVKNQWFWWVEKKYHFKDLKIIKFDSISRVGISVVIESNNEFKRYPCTMPMKNISKLKESLESKGVAVYSEFNI